MLLPLIVLGCNKTAGRKKVILIGVDGAGAFFSEQRTPNVYKIFNNDHSATTRTCITSLETSSAQCWGSMLTGVSSDVHRFNNDSIEVNRNTQFPTIFKQARTEMPNAKLASIVNWAPINYGIVEEGIDVHKEAESGETDDKVYERVLDYTIKETPDFIFVQFDSVDHAGHTYTYKSEAYYKALGIVDEFIGNIYKALEDNNLLSKYNFIVDADHGGFEKKHGGETDDEKLIFFGITGDNIKKTDIKDMRVRDVPAICARAMKINPNSSWDGKLPDIFK